MTDLVPQDSSQALAQARTPSSMSPTQYVAEATEVANVVAKVLRDQKLTEIIKGNEHVKVEGWHVVGTLMGADSDEEYVRQCSPGVWEAKVTVFDKVKQRKIGRSAICGDCRTWGNRESQAKRSMAITRAEGKAYKAAFDWVIKLAGFHTTPAEEMPSNMRQDTPQTTKAAAPQVIYNGAKDQREWVEGICKKENAAEAIWEDVHKLLLNGQLDASRVLKAIKMATEDLQKNSNA